MAINVLFYPEPVLAAGDNVFTGSNTFEGATTFAGGISFAEGITFTGAVASTGTLTAGFFNNFYYVDGTKYANLAAAVTVANNAGGGTIFTAMPETFLSDPFAGLGETAGTNIRVIFGPGTWSTKVPISVPALTQLIGAGRSLTKIQTVSGYSGSTGRTTCVLDVYGTVGTVVSDMEIDAGNGATIGIYATDINENSGFMRLTVGNFSAYGIFVDALAFWNEPAQTYFLRDIECYSEAAGVSGTTIGVAILGDGGGPALVQNLTALGTSGAPLAASLQLGNFTAGYFTSVHGEFTGDVLQLGTSAHSVAAVTLANITAGNGVSGAVVHIQNSNTGTFNILSVTLNTATYAIQDEPRSIAVTDIYVANYSVGPGSLGQQPILSTSPTVTNLLQNLNVLGKIGITTTTPGALLDMGDTLNSSKGLFIYNGGAGSQFGLGIGASQLQIYGGSGAGTKVSIGSYDGTTFTSVLDVVEGGGLNISGTAGVSAGPFTAISSITTISGIVTALSGTSDARLKDAVEYRGGLDELLNITPVRYKWNSKGQAHTGLSGEQEFVGFIAQNVQRAIPEAITATEKSKDGEETYLSLDDRPIIAALVNAVKELKAENAGLSARVMQLEERQ